jgi:hypothetical protein
MRRFVYICMAVLLGVSVLRVDAQVTNGTFRALTDANSARVVALG